MIQQRKATDNMKQWKKQNASTLDEWLTEDETKYSDEMNPIHLSQEYLSLRPQNKNKNKKKQQYWSSSEEVTELN